MSHSGDRGAAIGRVFLTFAVSKYGGMSVGVRARGRARPQAACREEREGDEGAVSIDIVGTFFSQRCCATYSQAPSSDLGPRIATTLNSVRCVVSHTSRGGLWPQRVVD